MLTIEVNYNQVFPSHKDITLLFDELDLHQIADTYWFVIDNFYLPTEETFYKALQIICYLLEQWYQTIDTINQHQTEYLLFDVSDQYAGCFRVHKQDSNIEVTYGYCPEHGGVSPFIFKSSLITETGFKPTSKTIQVPSYWLLQEIERERKKITRKLNIH